jgi:hypothetical protein
MLFAKAFADPATYATQEAFAAEWLLNSYTKEESAAYVRVTNEAGLTSSVAAHRRHLPDIACLTMAVYHSFSANAPTVARQVLRQMLAKTGITSIEFCHGLVKKLGTYKYKNWADREDNGSRYDRTRLAALRSHLWSESLIHRLMPENF